MDRLTDKIKKLSLVGIKLELTHPLDRLVSVKIEDIASGIQRLAIPDGVQRISIGDSYTKRGLDRPKIKEIIFPDSLERIETEAFAYFTELKQINLPRNLKVLETGAFFNCKKLEEVKLNDKLEKIGGLCFEGCNLRGKLKLPKSLIELGRRALFETEIEEVDFSECTNLKVIGDLSFGLCYKLKHIEKFPMKVMKDCGAMGVLVGCEALEDEELQSYT